jgi:tetratricopeptide (TPR) repeat protein
MRSAESHGRRPGHPVGRLPVRLLLAAALCTGAAGCASMIDTVRKVRAELAGERPTVDESAAAAAAAAAVPAVDPKPAPRAAPQPAPAPVADVEVSPEVQRAFDDARQALAAGKTQDAERRFRALAEQHPGLGGPHANLGLIYRQAGKLPEAVAALERAVQASPRQPVYFNQLGITYREAGQFAKARQAYEEAIALAPDYAASYLNLGILHDMYLAEGDRALALYDRYLSLSPGGDPQVTKWVADLKNRKPRQSAQGNKEKKE